MSNQGAQFTKVLEQSGASKERKKCNQLTTCHFTWLSKQKKKKKTNLHFLEVSSSNPDDKDWQWQIWCHNESIFCFLEVCYYSILKKWWLTNHNVQNIHFIENWRATKCSLKISEITTGNEKLAQSESTEVTLVKVIPYCDY